jgi:hypothetical protein
MAEQPNEGNAVPEMHRREITLADGRYMIFYTFGDEEVQPVDVKENEQGEDV